MKSKIHEFLNYNLKIMSKNLMIMAVLAFSLSSCKNETKNVETTNETAVETPIATTTPNLELGCYAYNKDGNETVLDISSLDNGVTGKLTYSLSGKDSNSGTFDGKMVDDKLIGTYTFMSEGKESKREVAFMLKDNTLIEGYGDSNADGTAFPDKTKINYTSTMPLTKTDCAQ